MYKSPLLLTVLRCSVLRKVNLSTYKTLIAGEVGEKQAIGLIKLNKPKTFNSLNEELMSELEHVVQKFDKSDSIKCMILTGTPRVFAAGADIREMLNKTFSSIYSDEFAESWNVIANARKPIIAAVNGYALGGGCELAMMCDIIIAGDRAEFGQPEITIGTIPGAGGTQRLTRAVGKSKAMEMILTGNRISAKEAQQYGLVSAVYPAEVLIDEAIKLGDRISANSDVIVQMAKEAVNSSFETSLEHGIKHSKSIFYSTFATHDRKEGMSAFIEKRPNVFLNK